MSTLPTGVFQIPEEQYFAKQAVSSSLLKEMRKSPAHGLAYLNRKPEPDTDAQRLGKIIDRAILEPARIKSLVVKPQDMSFATKEGKAWRDAHAGAEIIKFDEMEMVKAIVNNVRNHPIAGTLLKTAGKAQPSLFAYDEETGLYLKSRLDWLSGSNFIVDLKSTTTANPAMHGFPREIAKWRYHIQAAFYLDMCARLKIPVEAFVFIAMEKEAPFAVTTMQLDEASIAKGREEYRSLLLKYKECSETKRWPAYSEKMEIATIPDWALREQEYESPVAYELNPA